ncbi:hypothetical protein [Ensifer adhaerens]|nr:hypothetical protein [Ensifer adhaerens]RAS13535.1 hypothetical protein DEU52_106133 [Ensifer adhaerens]
MSIGSGIAYASFWFGLFGSICWFMWLVHREDVLKFRAKEQKAALKEQK